MGLKLAQPVELLDEALLEVFGVEGQVALADVIAIPQNLVALPAPDLVPVEFEESADEGLVGGAFLLRVKTNRECLLLDLGGFYIGLEMYPALILVVPVVFVELKIDASVIDLPLVFKPGGCS